MLTDVDVVKDLDLVLEGGVQAFLVLVARAGLGRDVNNRRTFTLPGSAFPPIDEASAVRRVRKVTPEWRSCRKWHSKHTDRSQTLWCDDELKLLDMVVKHNTVETSSREK